MMSAYKTLRHNETLHGTVIHKQGFTLMELLVYMAIVGIIVVIAGEAFSNSTKFRIRTDNMIRATQEAENVAMLFKNDVAQMGAKSSLELVVAGENDVFSSVNSNVYMDPTNATIASRDSSSYRISPANPDQDANIDSLIFRRVRYKSEDGDDDGIFQAVEEIAWFRSGTTLNRQCRIIEKASADVPDDGCAPQGTAANAMSNYVVEMATGVDSFKVYPGIPNVLSTDAVIQMFPPENGSSFKLVPRVGELHYLNAVVGTGGPSVSLTGLASNYSEDGILPVEFDRNEIYAFENAAVAGNWKTQCLSSANHFSFDPEIVYELSFGIDYAGALDLSQVFVPGRDHMSVGFRNADGDKISQIPDYMFYPPMSATAGNISRVMRFSVKNAVENACIAFTFAFVSPLVSNGTFGISSLKLKKVAAGYRFLYESGQTYVEVADKKNVKAFRLKLQVHRGGTEGKGEKGVVDLVVSTPSNGPRD